MINVETFKIPLIYTMLRADGFIWISQGFRTAIEGNQINKIIVPDS